MKIKHKNNTQVQKTFQYLLNDQFLNIQIPLLSALIIKPPNNETHLKPAVITN